MHSLLPIAKLVLLLVVAGTAAAWFKPDLVQGAYKDFIVYELFAPLAAACIALIGIENLTRSGASPESARIAPSNGASALSLWLIGGIGCFVPFWGAWVVGYMNDPVNPHRIIVPAMVVTSLAALCCGLFAHLLLKSLSPVVAFFVLAFLLFGVCRLTPRAYYFLLHPDDKSPFGLENQLLSFISGQEILYIMLCSFCGIFAVSYLSRR